VWLGRWRGHWQAMARALAGDGAGTGRRWCGHWQAMARALAGDGAGSKGGQQIDAGAAGLVPLVDLLLMGRAADLLALRWCREQINKP